MTDQYVAAGIAPPEKFTTVYSGMDVEPFLNPPRPREEVRRELGYSPGHIVVGKVARLFDLKGHVDVIDAARHVVSKNDQVRFLFVGDGSLRGQLEQQIAQAGLTGKFDFTLTWAMDRGGPSPASDADSWSSIFNAIQTQLGLKLEQKKGPVDRLVIDHAERVPTGN